MELIIYFLGGFVLLFLVIFLITLTPPKTMAGKYPVEIMNKPLYYTKAKEFLDLWEELGNKKEANY